MYPAVFGVVVVFLDEKVVCLFTGESVVAAVGMLAGGGSLPCSSLATFGYAGFGDLIMYFGAEAAMMLGLEATVPLIYSALPSLLAELFLLEESFLFCDCGLLL